jgi:alkylation response protein AidB-like acyl-CoA dehydrogenase
MILPESDERQALRAAVRKLGEKYGADYYLGKARSGEKTTELWQEAGRLGYLGVHLPPEHGGGGGGIGDLSAVCEELATAGCPLLLMVVSPAIAGTVIARFGTDEQRQRWLPGLASGELTYAFAITEPEAGSNAHRLTTTATHDGDGWVLSGQKAFISGVDEADAVLVVSRIRDEDTGRLKPALFVVPTDATGFSATLIETDMVAPAKQFALFFDEVRLPGDALVGSPDAGLIQLFAGLNPERIMAAAFATGTARHALNRAVDYARTRQVWDVPIGAHQAIAHPLATAHIDVELARLMTHRAAELYDAGDDTGAGEAANMAKYAAAEAAIAAVDHAMQTHGGNGFTKAYGLAAMMVSVRLSRTAPVSREMVLNFVAQHSLGLPRSY